MPDIDRLIEAWEIFRDSNPYEICDGREFRAIKDPEYCMGQMIDDTIALLKEQELPTELKQKMWNALYAEEDEYEKKFVGKEEHLNWFTVYRPWLQKGFDIAINTIAEWEGR